MRGIAVLDSGGQYCHLIARRVRELGVFAEILPIEIPAIELKNYDGIIISGGPRSVYEYNAPRIQPQVLELGKPLLGICYGQQLLAQLLGGEVKPGNSREYGIASLTIVDSDTIFDGIDQNEQVWMSHGDTVQKLPSGFDVLAQTDDCPFAAIADLTKRFYGLQFHPEVTHTQQGTIILENFIFRVCHSEKTWNPAGLEERLVRDIQRIANGRKVYFLVSGGVDSTVAYKLCAQALPSDKLEGLYVDTGFMRKNESEQLRVTFQSLGLPNVRILDRSDRFLVDLEKIVDPEEKRKRIGRLFFEVQEEVVKDIESQNEEWVLGQGTIYPDTIESGGTVEAAVIKTHHNRVSVISELARQGRLVEPLRELYKDEVRRLGGAIGLPDSIVNRHPFPGPGLAIRVLCTEKEAGPQHHPGVMSTCTEYGLTGCTLPLRSVGVQGDGRSYTNVAIIAGNADLNTIGKVSTTLTNRYVDVNRVAYCLDPTIDLNTLCVRKAFLSKAKLDLLREADDIAHQILKKHSYTDRIWQFPVVLIPVSRRGRQTESSVVLRPVCSVDGMTAEFAKDLPFSIFQAMEEEIRKLPQVDLVFLDVSNKPPATIEWE